MEQFIDKRNFISSSDSFALDILNYKRDGYYVEMGSADPIKGNTTYRMEKDYGWKGLGFDLNEQHAKNYNSVRSNPCLVEDATKFNYLKYFEENNFPKQIEELRDRKNFTKPSKRKRLQREETIRKNKLF